MSKEEEEREEIVYEDEGLCRGYFPRAAQEWSVTDRFLRVGNRKPIWESAGLTLMWFVY